MEGAAGRGETLLKIWQIWRNVQTEKIPNI